MAEETYEEGKKAGMEVGYRDGKSGQDSKASFEPTDWSREYARGWYHGYEHGHRRGKRMKKHLKGR